jgi:hypothetical protein
VWSWSSSECSKKGAGCDSAGPECSGGMGVLGGIVGMSLCSVVCRHGGGLVCVCVLILVMLPVGRAFFHPRVWMLCVHCYFVGLVGWSATGIDCGVMSGQ